MCPDGQRRYSPQAQALIDVVTAKYSRGPRLACGCQDRQVHALDGGRLYVFRAPLFGQVPPLPVEMTLDEFCADNAHDLKVIDVVSGLRSGERIELKGFGYPCITAFNAVQAWTLWELPKADGALGLKAVGSGKSLSSLMAPMAVKNCNLAVLLGEPSQRFHYKMFYLRLREHFRVPTLILDKPEMQAGLHFIVGAPALHFRPYSLLSQPKSTDLLEQLAPDLIIADECFTYNTKITTDRGPLDIGHIVNNKLNVKVVSRSSDGNIQYKPVVRWLKKNTPASLVKVVHETGYFICTPEHKVWTESGEYVRADQLLGKIVRTLSETVHSNAEDRGTECSRVVGIEVLERGGDGRFERCVGEDQSVYDLEVEDNHNYFADGVLVSNCHRISRRQNSSTNRILRYFSKNNHKSPRLCAWSGTLVKKSLRDIAHLSTFSLGMNSPYPIDPNEVDRWANVIDPQPMPDTDSATARALGDAFGYDLRRGLQARVSETYGVITTRGSSASASMSMHERKIDKIPEIIREKLSGVRNDLQRPDGEPLVEDLEIARCAREVGSGFHYYWFYQEWANAKTDEERYDIEVKIDNWFNCRKAFMKELRAKLTYPSVHMDSPMLCSNAAERAWRVPRYDGDLPVWPSETWPAWSAVKDKVQHESRTMWIDEYLARDAAEWGREHRGIIWYLNSAFGKKVAEILGVHCHGGGPDAEAAIMAESGKQTIVASIKAHGSGRDGLQHKFSEQLIAEIPSSNSIFEQLLGRLCRDGQKEDSISTWVYLHVTENKDALRNAIREAEFVEQSTGNGQLLLMCDRSFELSW